jgi:hypothetical protein
MQKLVVPFAKHFLIASLRRAENPTLLVVVAIGLLDCDLQNKNH